MGRHARDKSAEIALTPEAEALDSVRRSWYLRYVREGFPPAEALRRAKAYTPARERMRAIDPEHWSPR